MNGFIIIDKPAGITTYDCIRYLKKFVNEKIGHAGTLDPFSTGVVIILFGSYTKHQNIFMQLSKQYVGSAITGIYTDTLDITGRVIYEKEAFIDKEKLLSATKKITGNVEIKVPIFSSKKISGKRMYELARMGINIERPKKTIYIEKFEVTDINEKKFEFFIKCSKGTYVRSVVELLGEILDTPLVLESLRRTKIGTFDIVSAVKLYDIKSPDDILKNLKSA